MYLMQGIHTEYIYSISLHRRRCGINLVFFFFLDNLADAQLFTSLTNHLIHTFKSQLF